jgi:hypothetical protein
MYQGRMQACISLIELLRKRQADEAETPFWYFHSAFQRVDQGEDPLDVIQSVLQGKDDFMEESLFESGRKNTMESYRL